MYNSAFYVIYAMDIDSSYVRVCAYAYLSMHMYISIIMHNDIDVDKSFNYKRLAKQTYVLLKLCDTYT